MFIRKSTYRKHLKEAYELGMKVGEEQGLKRGYGLGQIAGAAEARNRGCILGVNQQIEEILKEREMILYKGKVKGLTFKELFLAWNFGRLIELLETGDFNFN